MQGIERFTWRVTWALIVLLLVGIAVLGNRVTTLGKAQQEAWNSATIERQKIVERVDLLTEKLTVAPADVMREVQEIKKLLTEQF